MKAEEKAFLETMKKFRKLHISSMLPGINSGDFAVMKTIDHCTKEQEVQCVKVSDLVKNMRVAAPVVSRCLKSLEGKEYIVRTVDTKDRRNTYVELTEKGKQVLIETEEIFNSFTDAVFGEMGSENMQALNAYLDKLLQTAQREIEKRKIEHRKGAADSEKNI